jgi:hypothetical protein
MMTNRKLPVRRSKPTAGRTVKLTEEHSKFLEEYIDEPPAAVLVILGIIFCNTFLGLTISISALRRVSIQKCKVALKKLENLTLARNCDRTVALRKEKES